MILNCMDDTEFVFIAPFLFFLQFPNLHPGVGKKISPSVNSFYLSSTVCFAPQSIPEYFMLKTFAEGK